MKTITSLLVIAVFIYIVYKRRISPIFTKKKNKKAKTSGTDTHIKDTVIQSTLQPVTSCQLPGIPLYGFTLDSDIRYDVMVFDYMQKGPDTYFGDRIEAKLSLTVSDMIEKGYPYRIDFITVGTALVILVTYRINQKSVPADIPSKDAS